MPLSYKRVSPEQAAAQSGLAAGLGGSLRAVGTFEEYMYAWPDGKRNCEILRAKPPLSMGVPKAGDASPRHSFQSTIGRDEMFV